VNGRGKLERLLGTRLPDGLGAISFERVQPSTDLAFFTAYARFAASPEQFEAVVDALGLRRGADAAPYLPAAWRGDREPQWWDPSAETPADAAARGFGANGWLVAKREGDDVYLVVTDTGASEATPGPW
jgi:hypothetical protein